MRERGDRLGYYRGLTRPQSVKLGLRPGFSCLSLRAPHVFSRGMDALSGVCPVHNLYRLGKVGLGDPLNPRRTIIDRRQATAIGQATPQAFGVLPTRHLIGIAQDGLVAMR